MPAKLPLDPQGSDFSSLVPFDGLERTNIALYPFKQSSRISKPILSAQPSAEKETVKRKTDSNITGFNELTFEKV